VGLSLSVCVSLLVWEFVCVSLSVLNQRTDPLEKTLMLGKMEGRMRRGQQRMR